LAFLDLPLARPVLRVRMRRRDASALPGPFPEFLIGAVGLIGELGVQHNTHSPPHIPDEQCHAQPPCTAPTDARPSRPQLTRSAALGRDPPPRMRMEVAGVVPRDAMVVCVAGQVTWVIEPPVADLSRIARVALIGVIT
jgi:hypothetical protein